MPKKPARTRVAPAKAKAKSKAKAKRATATPSKRGSAAPAGYRTLNAYLIIRDVAKAIEFYRQAFGAKERTRMPGPNGGVMHAELTIGDSTILLTEENPAWGSRSPLALGGTPGSLYTFVADVDAVFKRALGLGATAKVPPADMFWGDRFGAVTDPFGHEWALATRQRDLTKQQIQKGHQEFMAQMASGQKPSG